MSGELPRGPRSRTPTPRKTTEKVRTQRTLTPPCPARDPVRDRTCNYPLVNTDTVCPRCGATVPWLK